MLYPGLPFTQRIRSEFRKAVADHPKWNSYRRFSNHNVPRLNMMSREQLLATCDALSINVWEIVDRTESQWGKGRPYRKAKSDASFEMRNQAVRKLQELGYVYAGEKWQKKPEW